MDANDDQYRDDAYYFRMDESLRRFAERVDEGEEIGPIWVVSGPLLLRTSSGVDDIRERDRKVPRGSVRSSSRSTATARAQRRSRRPRRDGAETCGGSSGW